MTKSVAEPPRGRASEVRSDSGRTVAVRLSFMTWRLPAFPLLLTLAGGTMLAADPPNLTDQYRETADKLIRAAMADNDGYNRLAYLCYRIGNRLSGSVALERAIAWSVEQMKAVGLSNVRVIPTKVPHWVRNSESARMLAPLEKPLAHAGAGDEHRNARPEASPPTPWWSPISTNWPSWAAKRCRARSWSTTTSSPITARAEITESSGASRAAALGAVGRCWYGRPPRWPCRLPHTGAMEYDPDQPKIPAAAITPEDAYMLARLYADGTPAQGPPRNGRRDAARRR